MSVKTPPVNEPSTLSVLLAPIGLLSPENVTSAVAHLPGARLPKLFGNGLPLVVGLLSVAAVSLTFAAVVPPVFCTDMPTRMSPQLVRINSVVVKTNLGADGVGVGVGDGTGVGTGVGVGVGVGDGDGFGVGLGVGDGDGVGVGVGVGVGPPGCNSKAPASVPSAAFVTAGSSYARANDPR